MRYGRAALGLFTILAFTSIDVAARAQVSADEPAPADSAAVARQRWNAGALAYQQKRFVEAALNFEAASAAADRPNAIALFSAAQAWELADQPPRAADDFGRAIAAGLPPDRMPIAKDRLAALQSLLGRVDVTAPDGWRVQLDAYTEVPAPATLHAQAGMHTLSVRAPGKPIEKREVVLTAGKATMLELKDAPPPETKKDKKDDAVVTPPPEPPKVAAPKTSEESSGVRVRKTIGFVSIGVGGAALLGGVLLGLQANDAKTAYDAAPTRAAFDHAQSLSTWTNVMLIGGGVFAVGGLALVLWPSPKTEATTPAAEGDAPKERTDDEKKETTSSLVLVPTLGGAMLRGAF